jgi:phospholipase C
MRSETGGLGDHVTPYHSPQGTVGEWMEDPYAGLGQTYSGPGFRLPFYIVSPWTRGGAVFTEHSDHASQIMFIEEWLATKGKNVKTDQMVAWRRTHMSNLMNAFDFEHPDYSLPHLPEAPVPHVNAKGVYDGSSYCQSLYKVVRPDPPYGHQSKDVKDIAKLSESGFKSVRGALTEGRYLTFENDDYSLCVPGKGVKHASFGNKGDEKKHADENQKWVIHQLEAGGNKFYLSSGADGKYLTKKLDMTPLVRNAETFTIVYAGAGKYTIQASNGQYVSIGSSGNMTLSKKKVSLKTYSVT